MAQPCDIKGGFTFKENMAADLKEAFLKDPTRAIAAGLPTEHILLGSEEPEQVFEDEQPRTVQRRIELNNRARGVKTVFTFFDGGFLGIREHRGRKPGEEVVISLRYLDPRPVLSRSVATNTLYLAMSLFAFSALMGTLAYFSVLFFITLPAALASVIATASLLKMFIRRTHEQVAFHTKHGQVVVFTLFGNPGCFGASRALVPKLTRAISESRKFNTSSKSHHLREEMREHYRLREIGILTDAACVAGTRRILNRFD
jgi:hypothetical protein